MRYSYLLTSVIMLGLLVPLNTARSGGGAPESDAIIEHRRELAFEHACQSGPHMGEACEVTYPDANGFDGVRRSCKCLEDQSKCLTFDPSENQADNDPCGVKFIGPVRTGTLTIIADEGVNISSLQECPRSLAVTILFTFTKDNGQPGVFSDTYVSCSVDVNGEARISFCFTDLQEVTEGGAASFFSSSLKEFRKNSFVTPPEPLSRALRAFFLPPDQAANPSILPVIVTSNHLIPFVHLPGDTESYPELASVYRVRVGFRFAHATNLERAQCEVGE